MSGNEVNIFVRGIVGCNIRRIRVEQGLTQGQLAVMANVGRSFLSEVERGKQNVSLDHLSKLADGLDVPITRFFEGLNGDRPAIVHETLGARGKR